METPAMEWVALWRDAPPYGEYAVGDIDADGHPDIVATGSDEIAIWRCELESGAVAPVAWRVAENTSLANEVSLMDLTGDGVDDLVFALLDYRPEFDQISMIVAPGRINAAPIPSESIDVESSVMWIAPLDDFDGDGRDDVAYGQDVFLGSSAPPHAVFERTLDVVYEGYGWHHVTGIGDANEDGRGDVLVTDWDVGSTPLGIGQLQGGAQLFFGAEKGAPLESSFVPPTAAGEAAGASAVLADLDHDGVLELVTLSTTRSSGHPVDGAVAAYDLTPSGPELVAEFRFRSEIDETIFSRLLNLGEDPTGTARIAWVMKHEIRVLARDDDALVVLETIPAGIGREFGPSMTHDVNLDGQTDLVVHTYEYGWTGSAVIGAWTSSSGDLGGCVGGVDPDWVPGTAGTRPIDDTGTYAPPSLDGNEPVTTTQRSCGCDGVPTHTASGGWILLTFAALRRRLRESTTDRGAFAL